MKKVSKKTVKTISKKATKKTVANHNRRVARANKAFEALSPADKRVAIARDVLAQLSTKRLVPRTGVWLAGANMEKLYTKSDVDKNPELQSLLATKKECTGCALGGMFLCAVEAADDLKLGELSDVKNYQRQMKLSPEKRVYSYIDGGVEGEDAFKYLRKFFSQAQLEAIESAFERGNGSETHESAAFADDEERSSERMRLIMENIIANKGTFKWGREPELRYVTPGFVG